MRETWAQPLSWEDALEKGRLPTPLVWPGEAHGLYSPWCRKELDMTEGLSLILFKYQSRAAPIHFHIVLLGAYTFRVVMYS